MNHPDTQDMLALVSYVLDGHRERDDFFEAISMGDIEPEGAKMHELLGCSEDEDEIREALEELNARQQVTGAESFARRFGTSHVYPTALRVRAALEASTEVQYNADAKDGMKEAEDAYNRNVKG